MSALRLAPERAIRSLLLSGTALGVFLVLAVCAEGTRWWQQPGTVGAAFILAGGLALRGELRPELQGGEAARRALLYSPLALGILLFLALVFPTYGTWPFLWILAFLSCALLPFSAEGRVRSACLCLVSSVGFALALLRPAAGACLLPIGLCWSLIPALDTLSGARYRADEREGRGLGPVLGLALGVFAGGALLFALGSALLPESTRVYHTVDLLEPRGAGPPPDKGSPDIPLLELLALLAMVLGVYLFVTYGGSGAEEGTLRLSALASAKQGGGDELLDEAEAAEAVARWPAGPRRELVQRYLAHLRRLRALGYRRPQGTTPAAFGEALATSLPEDLGELPATLAARFGRARWAHARVEPTELDRARQAAGRVEEALHQRGDEGTH